MLAFFVKKKMTYFILNLIVSRVNFKAQFLWGAQEQAQGTSSLTRLLGDDLSLRGT